MPRAWIVVAHRAGARIIQSPGPSGDLAVLRDLLRPSPVPGESPKKESRADHLESVFARDIAAAIEQGRVAGAFDRLALVAPQSFLDRLRAALTPACGKMVVAAIDQDLPDAKLETIRTHLGNIPLD